MNDKLKQELLGSIDRVLVEAPGLVTVSVDPLTGEATYEVPDLFDVDRRYLFGYSNGGMLGYRIIADMERDTWAACWAMSTTCGGVSEVGYTPPESAIVNLPATGRRSARRCSRTMASRMTPCPPA